MIRAKDPGNFLFIASNFTPVPRMGYRIGVPENCFYKEILNSDSYIYWGSNMGNAGGVHSEQTPWQGNLYSNIFCIAKRVKSRVITFKIFWAFNSYDNFFHLVSNVFLYLFCPAFKYLFHIYLISF